MARWRIGIEDEPHSVRDVTRCLDKIMDTLRDKMSALLDDVIQHRWLRCGVRLWLPGGWPDYGGGRMHGDVETRANRYVVGV